jgi:hypothetical protein
MGDSGMSANMESQQDLLDFLTGRGFKKCKNTLVSSENACDWYAACRYPAASRCETNSNKPGIQIVVWPYELHLHHRYAPVRTVAIEITGEANNGQWYKLCAYSVPWERAVERFDELTESLVVAWDALPREEKALEDE